MRRFAGTQPPACAGVEYIVSWQLPQQALHADVPEVLMSRKDIQVYKTATKGLCVNRNLAMQHASAPLCLIADDDVIYDASRSFHAIIEAFQNTDADVICFKSTCSGKELKPYPHTPVYVDQAPKGWYAISFEIAYRRNGPAAGIRFNEHFGIGSDTIFQAGEEDIWLHDVRKAGASVMIFPYTICEHNHDTTHEKHCGENWFVMTSGAVHAHLHPYTWPLRCLHHALRQKRMSRLRYFMLCIKGVLTSRRRTCFK